MPSTAETDTVEPVISAGAVHVKNSGIDKSAVRWASLKPGLGARAALDGDG